MLKVLIACILSVATGFANAGANDMVFTKRNATDTGQMAKVYPAPPTDALLTWSPVIQDIRWTALGANLGITSGVLSATFSQVNADWNAASGASSILNKPTISSAASRDVAASGDANGAQVVVGSDTRLTNARAPVAHFHNASDIASGILDEARIPALTISKTTGLQTALDSKPSIKRIRAQTATNGIYTWTFQTPYAAGTIPVIGVTVEDSSSSFWNHQITALSNTSVTVQLTKTTAVTLLGISVLGIGSSPQAYVHLTAVAP